MARVLIILPILTLGGAEWQGFQAAKHLAAAGHDVEVWSFESPGVPMPLAALVRDAGIALTTLPHPSIWAWRDLYLGNAPWRNIGALRRHLAEVREFGRHVPAKAFDVVIPFTAPSSLFATLFAPKFGHPTVYWNHRGGMDAGGFLYNRFLKFLVHLRRTRFLCNSADGARFLSETFGVKPSAVTIIPNFVDFSVHSETTQSRLASNPEGSTENPPLLVHVANIYPEKDVETLIRAVPILKSLGIAARLRFIGRHVQAERDHDIRALLKSLDCETDVEFVGALDREQVTALLGSSAIGLLSTRSEGCPNAVLEYMVAGLPVVATDIPSIRHILPTESAAFLFPVGNPQACARAIAALLRDPDLRHRIGRANREHVVSRFSTATTARRWEDLVSLSAATARAAFALARRS